LLQASFGLQAVLGIFWLGPLQAKNPKNGPHSKTHGMRAIFDNLITEKKGFLFFL